MRETSALLILSILINMASAEARPVSYPGGWTGVTMNDGERSSLYVHYSPSSKYSLGYKFEYWRDGEYAISALQVNNLLERWNDSNYQGNLYLKSGIGFAYSDQDRFDGEVEMAVYTGITVDWESRRLFARYGNRYMEAGAIDEFFMQSIRIGVAPYLGDYGDLHTWLMLDIDHKPEHDSPITATPLLRFFKGFHLMEIGLSTRGDILFNWMVRY